MLRLGSRGCLALLGLLGMGVLACNKTEAGTGALGSPNASAAGSEAANPSSRIAGTSKAGNADGLARSLVAVAATSPGDAQPCERACGRVGDCLLETHDVSEFEAGRLELECLDQCVHSPESDGPRSAFLACEQRTSCGELLGCARSNWDALLTAHSGPLVQGITKGGDQCIDGCHWMIACLATGMPPGQALLDPLYEESMRSCETQCELISPAEREAYIRLGDCMRSTCGSDLQNSCFDSFY